jgi:hypothetical protein
MATTGTSETRSLTVPVSQPYAPCMYVCVHRSFSGPHFRFLTYTSTYNVSLSKDLRVQAMRADYRCSSKYDLYWLYQDLLLYTQEVTISRLFELQRKLYNPCRNYADESFSQVEQLRARRIESPYFVLVSTERRTCPLILN